MKARLSCIAFFSGTVQNGVTLECVAAAGNTNLKPSRKNYCSVQWGRHSWLSWGRYSRQVPACCRLFTNIHSREILTFCWSICGPGIWTVILGNFVTISNLKYEYSSQHQQTTMKNNHHFPLPLCPQNKNKRLPLCPQNKNKRLQDSLQKWQPSEHYSCMPTVSIILLTLLILVSKISCTTVH